VHLYLLLVGASVVAIGNDAPLLLRPVSPLEMRVEVFLVKGGEGAVDAVQLPVGVRRVDVSVHRAEFADVIAEAALVSGRHHVLTVNLIRAHHRLVQLAVVRFRVLQLARSQCGL